MVCVPSARHFHHPAVCYRPRQRHRQLRLLPSPKAEFSPLMIVLCAPAGVTFNTWPDAFSVM